MKYYILFIGLFFFISCSKEDGLNPSHEDRLWFVIEDDPQDALQHEIFKVYSDWGIPVFYNDTLGHEERGYNKYGEPIVYYKILDLNYSLNTPTNAIGVLDKYPVLMQDEADILAGVKFVDEVLLPVIPECFFVRSILLLDSLYEEQYGNKKLQKFHQAMETLALGSVPSIAKMSKEEQTVRANEIVTYLTLNYLNKNSTDENMAAFRKVSYDPVKQWSFYEMWVRKPLYPGYKCLEPARWEVYGFLDYDHSRGASVTDPDVNNWYYCLVKESVDVEAYIMAVLSYSKSEFTEKYKAYPKVMEKYRLMCEILTSIGFELK